MPKNAIFLDKRL